MFINEANSILREQRAFVNKFIILDYLESCQELEPLLPEGFFEDMNEEELLVSFDEFCKDEYLIGVKL